MNHSAFILAFNAADTLRACLRNIEGLFDSAVVVEGAVGPDDPWTHNTEQFTLDGRSTDETVEIVKSFPWVKLVQRAVFWKDKTEMCNVALKALPHGWAWQIDADEFFFPDKIAAFKEFLDLQEHTNVVAAEFRAFHFWGDTNHVTDPGETVWANAEPWRRVFRHKEGVKFTSHEPPVTNLTGEVIPREFTEKLGMLVYHYGYVTRAQVEKKSVLYNSPQTLEAWDAWQQDHSLPAYAGVPVVRYCGPHPVTL